MAFGKIQNHLNFEFQISFFDEILPIKKGYEPPPTLLVWDYANVYHIQHKMLIISSSHKHEKRTL